MSIYDRDYIRQAPGRSGGFPDWSVTAWIVGATIAVFAAQFLVGGLDVLWLWPMEVLPGAPWQLLTHALCHAGIWHILFNLLLVWWVGRELEALYGPKRYLLFYVLAVVAGGLAFVAGARWQDNPAPAVGASGAVMALLVLYAFHYPRREFLIYGILPMQARWMVALYVLIDVYGFAQGRGVTAYAAHLGGAAFGAAFALRERAR